jgi:transposase
MSDFTLSLDIDSLKITAQTIDTQGNIIFDVESTKTETACHKCGQLANKRYGFGETITVRHLPILDRPVYLRIRVARYECQYCDDHPTTSEQYDWCERKSKTTKGLDKYINRQLIHSTVEDVGKKEGISSEIVESSLNRVVNVSVDGFVEGLNNKIKVLKRRCYGMSKPESLFQRLFLDLRGYKAFA